MKLLKIFLWIFFCFYFIKSGPYSGPEWTSKLASEKYSTLWSEIIKDTSQQSFMNQQDFESLFYNEDMTPTFNLEQEEMPPGRKKTVHQVGLMSRCNWGPTDVGRKYTGIFNSGGLYCFMRINLAHNPDFDAFVPALSIKLFRDRFRSANLVLSGNMNGQNSQNFFENPMTNHPEIPTRSRFADHFSTGISNPFISSIGLQKWALRDQYGNVTPAANAVFPFQISVLPAQNLKQAYYQGEPWYNQVMRIQPNTIPFYIYAQPEPNTPYELIAYLVCYNTPTFSRFGDEVYFVKHNDMTDDLQYRPQWAQFLQAYQRSTREVDILEEDKPLACPFL